ncbi:protein-lysine N-methyltransferase EEF2KMT [Pelomyxa schiedti]|nr:protein-lysine N-methyltransferase EEF2KMT [Pelomyxa schiedti]
MEGVLRDVRRMGNVQKVSEALANMTSLGNQDQFYNEVLCDRVICDYPPSRVYMRSVLKSYITCLEATGNEINEGILDRFFSLMGSDDPGVENGPCYRSYTLGDGKIFTIRSNQHFNPVGLLPWPAGYHLAEHIMNHPGIVQGKTVIELGAGVGFTGLVIASTCQPKRVILTDYLSSVLVNLQHNIDLNKPLCTSPVTAVECDWDTPETIQSCIETEDRETGVVVLAADCVYDPDLACSLARTLSLLLHTVPASTALVSCTLREPSTLTTFATSLSSHKVFATHVHAVGYGTVNPALLHQATRCVVPAVKAECTDPTPCDCETALKRVFYEPSKGESLCLLTLTLKAFN